MKKLIALLLAIVLCFSLCACGEKENADQNEENTTQSIEDVPFLDLELMYTTIESNEAQAKLKYHEKMFKVKVMVMNIGTDSFEYRFSNHRGETKFFEVYMPTEVLATLKSGSHAIVLGKLVLNGPSASLYDAILVDENNIGEKTFDEETLKEAVENFAPFNSDGNIDWAVGSAPFFIENRLYFKRITPDAFLNEMSGEWTGRYYSEKNTEYCITFTSESTAKVSKNGVEASEWNYAFYDDMIKLPDKAVLEPCEVRKVSDNIVVFYADTVDYVPYWILYKA